MLRAAASIRTIDSIFGLLRRKSFLFLEKFKSENLFLSACHFCDPQQYWNHERNGSDSGSFRHSL
jgi:hypothetical protein